MPLKNLDKLNEELKKAAREKDHAKRGIKIAAVLAKALRQIDQEPILVGGSAVEFYTEGKYATKDIDMLAPGGRELWNVMKQLGFERLGKDYTHEKFKIYVEFPGDVLGEGETSDILDVNGMPLRIISVEDLIVNRLCQYKFWKVLVEGVNVLLLLELGQVDKERLLVQAQKKDVVDALEAISTAYEEIYRKKLSPKKAAQKLQEWLWSH
ncbi:MAG: hypothetical protein HY609_06740 [Deltaproteobacteria bacterium]|nr:hypothetical protein [Deltaproteobacteria bacterium]